MSRRIVISAVAVTLAIFFAAGQSQAADYRGMTPGWPSYANGYYAASYPTNYSAGGAYYVARPVAAGYAAPATGAMYMPTTAAYANPSYFAAYGRSPVAYRPVTTVGYSPAAGYYAPNTAYYAPVTANYAPSNSYAVQPAGVGSAGSEAAAYFGQPTPLNYAPPQFTYRPTYSAVPVYMYRPVTAYDPITAQPQTCLQASTCNTCQPARSRCSSWWNPFGWFSGSSRCGSSGCGSSCGYTGCGAAPTTAYCGQAACGQQPYYPGAPLTPVVPMVPAPVTATPAFPRTFQSTPTIPPPPTMAPGTRQQIITNPGITSPGLPADVPPNLGPRTFGPAPGGSFAPSTQPFTPLPNNPNPGGSFQTNPGVPPASTAPSFGSGANYAPATDPYSSSTMTPAATAPRTTTSDPAPNHSVFGSGFRGQTPAATSPPRSTTSSDGTIRAPELGPALPPSVQTVPDLDAPQMPKPVNSAPQLLNPRDKTAGRDPRWAVVPAKWPPRQVAANQLGDRPVTKTRSYQPSAAPATTNASFNRPAPTAADYSDGGWKSAAF